MNPGRKAESGPALGWPSPGFLPSPRHLTPLCRDTHRADLPTQDTFTTDFRTPASNRVSDTGLPLAGQRCPFIRTKTCRVENGVRNSRIFSVFALRMSLMEIRMSACIKARYENDLEKSLVHTTVHGSPANNIVRPGTVRGSSSSSRVLAS